MTGRLVHSAQAAGVLHPEQRSTQKALECSKKKKKEKNMHTSLENILVCRQRSIGGWKTNLFIAEVILTNFLIFPLCREHIVGLNFFFGPRKVKFSPGFPPDRVVSSDVYPCRLFQHVSTTCSRCENLIGLIIWFDSSKLDCLPEAPPPTVMWLPC